MSVGRNCCHALLPLVGVVGVTVAFLASGCVWGLVMDPGTGAGVSGASVSYSDAEGHTGSTTSGEGGLYAFDQATGPVPAAGAANFEVNASGYEPVTATRLIEYDDNPGATLANPSSFWEVQHFAPVPEGAADGCDCAFSLHRRTQHGVIAARTWSSVTSYCRSGEVVTGGGYSMASIGFSDKVNASVPVTDLGTGREGWVVEVFNNTDAPLDVWVTAICAE